MTWTSAHIPWLVNTGRVLTTIDRKSVEIWELRHTADEAILSEWARHFRNHYCSDSQIDSLLSGSGQTRTEYLKNIKFPTDTGFGPLIRSGDFSEILVADYLEYVLKNWVPRTRYINKDIRDESTKGSDVIGFTIHNPNRDSPRDSLLIYEVKAKFTGSGMGGKLQEAINHSKKDDLRKAESLNAIKQNLINMNEFEDAKKVERFQDSEDRPYKEFRGAVAFLETALLDEAEISASNSTGHPYKRNLKLIVMHGESMMTLIHELYKRAADEA